METVYWYDSNSKLLKQINCQTIQLTTNKEKELIEVNGNGTTIAIHDASICACIAEEDGRLIIETNAGRQIVFLHTSETGTFKLLARLNKVLGKSNCTLRFQEPDDDRYRQILQDLENDYSGHKKSTITPALAISGLAILVLTIFAIIASNSANKKNVDSADSPPIVEDAWEARLRRDKEEWDKQQEKEINSQQVAPAPQNKDTEIASIMLSVSCAGNKGLIPRSQMGSMMKEMFQDKGIDSTEVYGNWDYYWGIAKEMDVVNKTYCLK